jgi:hypothetical protein
MANSNPNFSTPRTRELRATELKPADERTVAHIEDFGCSVVHIKPTKNDFGWSYTIGVFDTCGQPELIAVGLPEETAHFLLNEAVNLLRKGIDLSTGRHPDLIGNVECEFRPVDPKWVNHVMNWDIWYYRDDIPPVLQAVYPDKANRFPEDKDFDENHRVPLLRSAENMQTIEDDFWASNDPKSSLFNWPFSNPPHTGVYLSQAVHAGVEPATYVSHDQDGDWQFHGDSMANGHPPVVSCFHHPIDADSTLKELADLPIGWYAERVSPGEPWTRQEIPPDEEEEQ